MPGTGSDWSQWYPPPSAPRPVEGGLKARSRRGQIGESWWSQRFLALLESFGIGERLNRGRTYARKGQVISLGVVPGAVTAEVQGSRARPYRVRIGAPRLSETDWRRAEEAMVSRAAFLARLLAGEMPADIEEAFAEASAGLFPTRHDELVPECSCPDWSRPCKHVAAVYFLLAEAFDDDPFLIFTWRGRPRDILIANLRALRGSSTPADTDGHDDPWATVEMTETPALAARLDSYWDAGPAVRELRLDPRAPVLPSITVRNLGPLDRDVSAASVVDLLTPAYATITTNARAHLLDRDDGDAV